MTMLRVLIAGCALVAVPLAANASKSFSGPATWSHVASSTPGAERSQDVWKSGDSPSAEVLAVMSDSTMNYDGIIAAVRANVAGGGMKLGIDKDITCEGNRAHTFEMSFGPDGKKTLVNQTIVADGDGTTRITYTRADGKPYADDVKAAISAYCGM